MNQLFWVPHTHVGGRFLSACELTHSASNKPCVFIRVCLFLLTQVSQTHIIGFVLVAKSQTRPSKPKNKATAAMAINIKVLDALRGLRWHSSV